MSALRQFLADYLATRRALGYKLERAEKLLGQFLAYLEDRSAKTITIEQAVAWARLPGGSANWLSSRLSVVRGFAAYLNAIDPTHEVPPAELLPGRSRRATPYVYSGDEITALIHAAGTLRTAHRRATYRTLIGLLSVTGMRVGEMIALDRRNIDSRAGVIRVYGAKFGKSRELPLDPSVTTALHRYLRRRDRPPQAVGCDAAFVSTGNCPARSWRSLRGERKSWWLRGARAGRLG